MTFAACDRSFPSRARAMARTLAWGEVAGCLPGEMLVVLVRVERERGLGLSATGRRGVRRVVALARDFARRLDLLPPALPRLSRVYSIPWLNVVL